MNQDHQQHRATPDQWHNLYQYLKLNSRIPDHISITLELAARIEALELALRIQSGNLASSEQTELGVVPAADMKAAAASTASKARGAALSKLAPPPFPLDPYQHQGPVEEALVEQGVFKGQHGLEGLLNAEEFWSTQPYGTRLYYGEGGLDYLHRDVLRAAVQILASRKGDARPGGLVERMGDKIADTGWNTDSYDPEARKEFTLRIRAAIREAAAWLEARGSAHWLSVALLRREADRG
jgi:hypothetical protein